MNDLLNTFRCWMVNEIDNGRADNIDEDQVISCAVVSSREVIVTDGVETITIRIEGNDDV
jgi:hypothetical protein